MAQPFPPQGEQKQYNERPLKIYGEQYLTGQPLPIGARTDSPTGETVPPYVVTAAGRYHPLTLTDWVVSSRYTGAITEVLSAEEFAERFGGGGGPPAVDAI